MQKRKPKHKTIVIDLTKEQIEQLQPFFNEVDKAWDNDKPVMVLAQAFGLNEPEYKRGKLGFGVVPNEISEQIRDLIDEARLTTPNV